MEISRVRFEKKLRNRTLAENGGQKQNTLYFRLCKNCEFMMCILIVDHQFNRMHP